MFTFEIPNLKNWKTAFLLSMIVPVSLLVTFKLTGIIKEPITPETITLDPVNWEFNRSNKYVHIDDKLNVTYIIDGLRADMYVVLGVYVSNSLARYGHDYLTMAIMMNLTATSPNCFVEGVYITFSRDSKPSLIDWVHTYFDFANLSFRGVSRVGQVGRGTRWLMLG